MKKVLLILIDALTARLLEPMIERGEYPNLKRLCDHGRFQQSISIFPSITHAALSSFATGTYPREHGIVGTYFYRRESDEIGYFGSDFSVVLRDGLSDVFFNFTVDLNHNWLQRATLYEKSEELGFFTTCLNCLIFRGQHTHHLNPPLLMQLIPNVNSDIKVKGPTNLFLGDFVNDTPVTEDELELFATGPQNWYGFKDSSTLEILLNLAQKRKLTDLTVTYLAENDFIAHDEGPEAAHHQLQEFDNFLGNLFETFGGVEETLTELAIVITGDHSQSAVLTSEGMINLAELLANFSTVPAGEKWGDDEDILVAPNLRAATLYLRDGKRPSLIKPIIETLLDDPRVDQIICAANQIAPDHEGIYVVSKRGALRFWAGNRAKDLQGNGWDWKGNLAVVNGKIENGRLTFPIYPNAFERIQGVVDAKEGGEIWATAELGYEFYLPGIESHTGGGSHGSLHYLDSLSPLITAGLPNGVTLPAHPRLVDIAPLCLDILAETDTIGA